MTAVPSPREPPTSEEPDATGQGHVAPLERSFYARPAITLARALLGCVLVASDDGGLTTGRIVETEAYRGPEDRASHARAGLTPRTAPMFGPPGHAYVYLVYGMHSCLNVVAEEAGAAAAVLIRAIEPVNGVTLMRERRGPAAAAGSVARLTAGPARLCQAMGVTRALDGHDLTAGARLWIAAASAAVAPDDVLVGPRVGVAYAGEWAARPWRFGVRGSGSLSRPFPRDPAEAAMMPVPR
jgi:DNA-3-methyladenine glycosylase